MYPAVGLITSLVLWPPKVYFVMAYCYYND
jgi:hypothetical protein